MAKMDWSKLRHAGKLTETHETKRPEKAKGGWSHVKRAPVVTFNAEQKAEYLRGLGL